MLHRIRTT